MGERRRTRHALALALVLGTAVGCDGGDDRATEAGDVIWVPQDEVQGGEEFVLATPAGAVRVTVGDPAETVEDPRNGEPVRAPEGTSWVPVAWAAEPGEGLSAHHATVMGLDAPPAPVRVSAGEVAVVLADAGFSDQVPADDRPSGGVHHVALPQRETPTISVDFDGRSSSVDTGTGALGGDGQVALARLPDAVTGSCVTDDPLMSGEADVECGYTVVQVPYLSGRSWSDRWWTVALVSSRVDEFTTDDSRYRTGTVEDTSQFSGVQWSEHAQMEQRRGAMTGWVLAEGTASTLWVQREMTGAKVDGPGPDEESVRLTLETELRLDDPTQP